MLADARKVKQIIYNLLSNAVKFSSDGGRVTLRAEPVSRADVGLLTGPRTGRAFPLADSDFPTFLKVSVTDTGIGISPEGLAKLFTPFSQIDSGLSRKFEGTGLGLAMVKILAELHGGIGGGGKRRWRRLLTSRSGCRSERTMTRSLTKSPTAPPIAVLPGTRTALVVEDDLKAAELIGLQLEAEGFQVLHAASAEAALLLVAQQPLSLITLDIMLPNMDGWELLGRLKQVKALKRIPVLIISIVADRNKGFALGAAAVMQKPISRQELYDSLVDLSLFPLSQNQTLKVLVVDDDPKSVELISLNITGLASIILRAYGGREAIDIAQRELPDLIVLDLMMPDVNGFDVVEALHENPETTRIPILVVTAKQISAEDRHKLNGFVTTIMEKAEFNRARFTTEIRRAMSGRAVVV